MAYRGCISRSPAASQNQLGRVKALCDLAHLASGVYCTMFIIINTNSINFYSFHFSFQCIINRGFLEISCLCTCTEIHTLDETMVTHTRVPMQITHNIRPTRNFMPRAVPSQPAKFELIFATKCLQCRDTKMSKSEKYLSNRAKFFYRIRKNFI